MANEDAMFSFQMMNTVSSVWPVDVQTSEMYRCSQVTLSQLQEKVLRSLSKRREEDNLQVVPQNDNIFEEDSPIPYRESCAVNCRENCAKNFKESVENYGVSSSRELRTEENERHQTLSRSLATCNSTEPLRTPTFPFSPLLKSPAHCLAAPASPLAMMLLSPFGRKPSEDLSMYLPENFTPAATLERLERSISATVFEFPSVEENQNDDKPVNLKREKHKEEIEEEMDVFSTEDDIHVNSPDIFVELNDDNCFEVKPEGDYYLTVKSLSTQNKRRREKREKEDIKAKRGDIVRFRNSLERKRRSEMNCKYDKLRRCIPEIERRQKVAKIVVLRSAIEYIQDLHRQDKVLTKQKNIEKLKNEELLRKLVRISS